MLYPALEAAEPRLARLLAVRRPSLLVVLFSLLVLLPGFFTLPPGDRDESRFAQATRQMLESGDFVEIRYGDEARNKKPVGIHWAQAASVAAIEAGRRVLGLAPEPDAIWPYRIPSVLGTLLAALFTFRLGRRLVGERAGLLAGLLMAASMVAVVEGHIAKTDAAVMAATAAAMGLLGRFYLDQGTRLARGREQARQGAWLAAGFWVAIGAGLLLKGPVTPLVALLAVLALWWADRRGGHPRPLSWLGGLRTLWGLPLALLLVLPWFVWVMAATDGAFLLESVNDDLRPKVEGTEGFGHEAPPGYYLATVSLTFFPGALLAWCALPFAWRRRAEPATRFLLAWLVPTWIMFELLPVKLPHYVSPTFPALALLAARWTVAVAEDPLLRPGRWLKAWAILAFALVVLALGAAGVLLPWLADRNWDPVAFAVPAAALLALALVVPAALADRWPRTALMGLATAPLLYWGVLEGVLPRLNAPWISPRAAAAIEAHWRAAPGAKPPGADRLVGVSGYHEPSLMFLVGTGLRLLPGEGVPAAAHLATDPRALVLVRDRHEAAFLAEAARLGIAVRKEAAIPGYNYSRGHRLALLLYARAP